MLFSESFNIQRGAGDDWFDPILETDTELFVDPFLIFRDKQAGWRSAHSRLIKQYDGIFLLLAKAQGNKASPFRKLALAQLRFPEPQEFCIGYTAQGVDGAGGGGKLAEQIAVAMEDAIKRGTEHLPHFEVLGIFNRWIGPDRISDLTCTALKKELVDYTVKVAERHGLTTKSTLIKHAGVDNKGTIREVTAALPINPFTNRAVLLVPERFLRQLPTLNADDWWQAELSKATLNVEVMEGVDKKKIVQEARRKPRSVDKWSEDMERSRPRPYDLDEDTDLLWKWEPVSREYTEAHPIKLQTASTQAEFFNVIDQVCEAFRHYVERDGGWELLWNEDKTEKKEPACQNLFRGIAKHYCYANNISIDREVRLGRGPVDFKFSRGRAFTAHLEVKKLDNGEFWKGLYTQLVLYMQSDEVKDGWIMGVRFRPGGVSKDRAVKLPAEVRQTGKEHNLNLRYALVDAQRKVSASKAPGKRKPNKRPDRRLIASLISTPGVSADDGCISTRWSRSSFLPTSTMPDSNCMRKPSIFTRLVSFWKGTVGSTPTPRSASA
jgi:hypothetical protein